MCALTLLSDIGLVYIGLVSLILLGWELHVLYHCTMCTRHPNLVSFAVYAIPIFHILIEFLHLLVAISTTEAYGITRKAKEAASHNGADIPAESVPTSANQAYGTAICQNTDGTYDYI